MTSSDATLYELRGKAAWITLNRPDNRNALSAEIVSGLVAHIGQANVDARARAIVITGSGTAFCAGADLKNDPSKPRSGPTLPELLTAILESSKPVIAAINGAAFAGGLGLVGASDIVITSAEAVFSFSEVKIGVIPAVIAVVCVPKLGAHNASKLFLTGERFNGARAVELGLAHVAVSPGDLAGAVQEQVDALALGAPGAISECKKMIRRVAASQPIADAFREMETLSQRMFAAAEGQEGMAAFREKRKPSWTL